MTDPTAATCAHAAQELRKQIERIEAGSTTVWGHDFDRFMVKMCAAGWQGNYPDHAHMFTGIIDELEP